MGLEDRKVEKTIGDEVYSTWPMAAGKGREALLRLIGIVSPLAGKAISGGSKLEAFGSMLQALPSVLGADDVKYFCETFGPYSRVIKDGKAIPLVLATQDEHFAGRYTEMTEWLAFCIEVNFGPFFRGLIAKGGNAESIMKAINLG